MFSQEYPLIASEAFISSDFDSFITPDLVLRARREVIEPYGPLMIGVDPAGSPGLFTTRAALSGSADNSIQ